MCVCNWNIGFIVPRREWHIRGTCRVKMVPRIMGIQYTRHPFDPTGSAYMPFSPQYNKTYISITDTHMVPRISDTNYTRHLFGTNGAAHNWYLIYAAPFWPYRCHVYRISDLRGTILTLQAPRISYIVYTRHLFDTTGAAYIRYMIYAANLWPYSRRVYRISDICGTVLHKGCCIYYMSNRVRVYVVPIWCLI